MRRRNRTEAEKKRFLLRYFGTIGLIVAIAAFTAPTLVGVGDKLTPEDGQKLFSLGGAAGGVALILWIASFTIRDRRR
ncbi:hypothetical protein [Altericroceibacterium spongiae]|nr:hypothetical protein [Altericroceibacterium spongiae]